MPYSWQTPITNRTSASYYNYTDPNRVDNNTRYLEEYIETNLGYSITLSVYSAQTLNSLPTYALINLLEANINVIKNVAGTPTGWITLYENWSSIKDSFVYTDANNLEQNQVLLKAMVELIVESIRYCGTFYCGEDNAMFTTEELL